MAVAMKELGWQLLNRVQPDDGVREALAAELATWVGMAAGKRALAVGC